MSIKHNAVNYLPPVFTRNSGVGIVPLSLADVMMRFPALYKNSDQQSDHDYTLTKRI